MFVLDTNTLIYYFKGMGNVSENLLAREPQEIAIPSIVVFELEFGIAKSTSPQRRQKQLETFFSSVTILPFGEQEARQAAAIRAALEKGGEPIGPYDVLIAATTLANQGTLVTHNTKEFGRVEGLNLVDWY
jgi:tRNA(fMet)-specific endonuclease VapC